MSTRVFLLNFKPQFVPLIERGEKRQTIRQDRKDGKVPHQGDTVKLYTGLRTRGARMIAACPVVECFTVHMDLRKGKREIVSNGIKLHPGEANSFARLDGFQNATEMFDWFETTYDENSDFNGFCVRWRPPSSESAQ
jgi:hypothetical protein